MATATRKSPKKKSKTPARKAGKRLGKRDVVAKLTPEMMRTIDALGDNWMVRTDNDGKSYSGFEWNGVGVWTEAPDWNAAACCGYGLHGQGPGGYGYWHDGTRFVFCETGKERVTVEGNKVKVKRARILYVGAEAYLAMAYACRGKWAGQLRILCTVALPSLKEVTGSVDVYQGATFTAPVLAEVTGSVDVYQGATFTAPVLAEVTGYVAVYQGATFTAPVLAKTGSVDVYQGATFTAPVLAKTGSVDVYSKGTLNAPKLKR